MIFKRSRLFGIVGLRQMARILLLCCCYQLWEARSLSGDNTFGLWLSSQAFESRVDPRSAIEIAVPSLPAFNAARTKLTIIQSFFLIDHAHRRLNRRHRLWQINSLYTPQVKASSPSNRSRCPSSSSSLSSRFLSNPLPPSLSLR